jgi:hypothetical protein
VKTSSASSKLQSVVQHREQDHLIQASILVLALDHGHLPVAQFLAMENPRGHKFFQTSAL